MGCVDGEEFGDGGEVGDVAEGLIGAFNRNTTIRVRAGMKNSRPVGFLL